MSNFVKWISQFADDPNSVGDFVRQVLNDPNFTVSQDYDDICEYLYSVDANYEEVAAFKQLWAQYSSRGN